MPGYVMNKPTAGRDTDGSDGRVLVFIPEIEPLDNIPSAILQDNNTIEKQGRPTRQPIGGVD
jgi:hypothetical protein